MNWLPRNTEPLQLPPRPGVKSYSPPMKHDRSARITTICPLCQCQHASTAEFNLCKEWYKATEAG
jgi:hypothetical protein